MSARDSDEARIATFDAAAEAYERFRPGYPEALIDDVVRLSGLPPGGRVLEIGSGTGKATEPFARRGYALTCVEPGARLVAVARRKLAAWPGTRFEVGRFETWSPGDARFDLVIAAQCFHFLDPLTALPKMAAVLDPGGAIAIFRNEPQRGVGATRRDLDDAYTRFAPELIEDDPRPEVPLEARIAASGCFEPATVTRHPWRATYTAAEYAGLMGTQSHHRLLPADRRAALLGAIEACVAGRGGSIDVDYVAELRVARLGTPG